MKKIVLILALTLMCASLSAQTSLQQAVATMGNGYRATNTAIKKMLKKGFGNNLFKKAGREVK